MEPIISVIIPMFNVEKWVERCLRSVIVQSYKYFEIICLDDASEDDTCKYVESLTKYDNRIQLHKFQNHVGNPGQLRNLGLDLAEGNYVTFVDADDMLEQHFLDKMLQCVEKYNVDIVCGLAVFKRYGKDVVLAGNFHGNNMGVQNEEQVASILLDTCYHGAVWGKLFLRSFLNHNNIRFDPELKLNEDQNFCIKAISQTKKIAMCDAIYYYVRHKDSLSNEIDRDYVKQCSYAYSKNLAYLGVANIDKELLCMMRDRMLEERYNVQTKCHNFTEKKEYFDDLMKSYYKSYENWQNEYEYLTYDC